MAYCPGEYGTHLSTTYLSGYGALAQIGIVLHKKTEAIQTRRHWFRVIHEHQNESEDTESKGSLVWLQCDCSV